MNSLSMFLYAADVVDNIKSFAIGGVVAGTLGAGASVIIGCLAASDANNYLRYSSLYSKEDCAWAANLRDGAFGWAKRALCVVVVSACIAAVLPSQRTLHMIAASEIGEQVAATPEAREMFNAVRVKLLDALKVDGGK